MPPVPENPRPLPDGALYFVGIGGAGMSALAQVLAERGRSVAGADPGISAAVRERLERVGATVYNKHAAEQIGDAAVVVVSDAIPESNPEVALARERGLPIFRRPEVLGAILNAGRGIAIAGTHGKTTTTGMVASILMAAGLDPTIILGGDLPAIGGNARNGKGDIVLAEACEAYDGILYLHPEIAVVLNVEADHLDYHVNEAHVISSFERFIKQVKPNGCSILCEDDLVTRELGYRLESQDKSLTVMYYSLEDYKDAAVYFGIQGSMQWSDKQLFDLYYVGFTNYKIVGAPPIHQQITTIYHNVELKVPGRHNLSNALVAIHVAVELSIEPEHIIAGLASFTGTGRRFERIGEVNGVLIVDDYAHHPTELRATLSAARAAYPERRIVAVFQPHLPSRTRDNRDGFAEALSMADAVYLTDIYLAREQPIPGVSSSDLADLVRSLKPEAVVAYVPDKMDLPARLAEDVRPGDIVLTLGAGDIRVAGTELLKALTDGGEGSNS